MLPNLWLDVNLWYKNNNFYSYIVPVVVGTVVGDAGIGCDNISDYYLEIGCSPGTTQKPMNGTKCPKAFTCPEIANRDAGKCYYR